MRLAAEMLPPEELSRRAARVVEQAVLAAPWDLTTNYLGWAEGKAQLQVGPASLAAQGLAARALPPRALLPSMARRWGLEAVQHGTGGEDGKGEQAKGEQAPPGWRAGGLGGGLRP